MEETHKPITLGEEKELRRVHNTLCNFLPKSRIHAIMRPLKEERDHILSHKKNPDIIKIFRNNNPSEGELSDDEINKAFEKLRTELENLQEEVDAFDKSGGNFIRAADLNECLKSLGYHATKKEVDEMIWEVDENLDECVDWEEFKLVFQRNVSDTTGLEPCQLFNLASFMMYDKDGSGQVSVDETMHMLYARYGRDNLESQMEALFGERLLSGDKESELSYQEYVKAVSVQLYGRGKKKKKKSKSRQVKK